MCVSCVLPHQPVVSNHFPKLTVCGVANQGECIVHRVHNCPRQSINMKHMWKVLHYQWPSQHQRHPHRPRKPRFCLSHNVPSAPMMGSLRTVAEAVVSLLTLLLQFMIHQLEGLPENPENPPEMMQTLGSMVQELQNQRTLLQSLMSQGHPRQSIRDSTGASTQAESSPKMPAPRSPPTVLAPRVVDVNSLPVSSQRVTQAIHRQLEAPASEAATMVTNRVTNWQVLEESEEEVIVDIEGRRLELSPVIPALPAGSAQRAPCAMTVGDWGQTRIGWGKKHKGKTYAQVYHSDSGYFQWANARYNSLTPEIQDFVRYCRVQEDLDQHA